MHPEDNALPDDAYPNASHSSEASLRESEDQQLIDENVFEPTEVDQKLTAYLDGELDPDEAIEIEQQLHADPECLAKLQAFQRTWDFFDAIPVEVADNSFVRTTMEIVIADVKTGMNHSSGLAANTENGIRVLGKRVLRGLAIATIPLILLGGSFAFTRKIQTTPHRTLIQNLPLIENLDRYNRVDFNLEFLNALDQQELFAESRELTAQGLTDLSDGDSQYPTPKSPSDEEEYFKMESERLASMSPSKRREIQRLFEEFQKLSPEQAKKAIRFHESLMEHPDRVRLIRTLNHYYSWIRDLNSLQIANLLDSSPEERLKMITRLRAEQAKAAFGRLGETKLPDERDEEHLLNWFEFTLKANERAIRSRFPAVYQDYLESQKRTRPDVVVKTPEELRRIARTTSLPTLVAVLLRIDREAIQDMIFEHVAPLRDGLSSKAQEIIRSQPLEDQSELVMNWIETANQARTMIPEERLQEFYEHLPPAERDELDQLSFDEWKNALIDRYRSHHSPRRIDDLERLFLNDLF